MNNQSFYMYRDFIEWAGATNNAYEFEERIAAICLYAFDEVDSYGIPDDFKRRIDSGRKTNGRKTAEYKEWRSEVFSRDSFTCLVCGQVGGKLNAHHIKPYAYYPELRYEVSNGVTLCERCHKAIHKR